MSAILYARRDRPTCIQAREFLSSRGIPFEPRDETLALSRRARDLWIKAGPEILHLGPGEPPAEAEVIRTLVHEDGFMRVPVLIRGDLLVRGYTETLYRRALGSLEA